MDIFGRFARDPSCLAAINAADGGSWRSPFRPGVVYPSAVPRNFAAEQAVWYDAARFMREADPASDYDMSIEWADSPTDSAHQVFYCTNGASYAQPGIYRISPSQYSVIYNPFPVVAGAQVKVITRNANANALRIVRAGTSGYAEYNGVRFAESTGTTPNALMPPGVDQYYSYHDGTIENVRLKVGNKLWQYPSFEEHTRLITKLNIWTANGVFETARSAGTWSIKYSGPVPAGDYTAVIDTTAAVIAQVRKSGVTTTYTNGVSGGTLPYLTLGTSTLSGAYGTKMRHFLLFDRVLSIGEIQILR